MNHLPFTLSDIMNLCSISRSSRLKGTVCPFCGHHDSMYYNLNENVFHCFKCDAKGGTIDFYRTYMKKPDNKTAYTEIMKSLFGEDLLDQKKKEWIEERRKQIESMQKNDPPLRPLQDRDRTYRALLDLFTLASDHSTDLLNRGLSQKVIEVNGYKTLPNEKTDICNSLSRMDLHLDGVPGFFTVNGEWRLGGNKRGFLVPVRSHGGLIQGFQIRKDAAAMNANEGKYYWLSSKGYPNGTGVPGAVHYACDFQNNKPIFHNEKIFLTEGALKGDIAHHLSGKPFLCVPGVNCLNQLKPELEWLKEQGVKIVNICYDMDYKTNSNVQRALMQTYTLIHAVGLQPVSIEWDAQHKGIDDYLLGRSRIESKG